MTFVIPVISHLSYQFSRWSILAHPAVPATDGVLKPLLVGPALRPHRSLHLFVDPMGGFLVEKLCGFFPDKFIHVLTIGNLCDNFQFTLWLHMTPAGENISSVRDCTLPFAVQLSALNSRTLLIACFDAIFPCFFLFFAREWKAALSCSQFQPARSLWTPKFRLQGPLVPSPICHTKKQASVQKSDIPPIWREASLYVFEWVSPTDGKFQAILKDLYLNKQTKYPHPSLIFSHKEAGHLESLNACLCYIFKKNLPSAYQDLVTSTFTQLPLLFLTSLCTE